MRDRRNLISCVLAEMAENSRIEGVSPEKKDSQSSQSSGMDVPRLEAQKANTHLEHWCLLDVFTKPPHTLCHTGIICTIGMYKTLTSQKCRSLTHMKLLYFIQCMNFIKLRNCTVSQNA